MKKLFLFCAIALIGLVSCEKQAMLEQEVPELEKVAKVSLDLKVLSAGEETDTKAVKSAWATGDKIYLVFEQNKTYTKEDAKRAILTYSDNGKWEVTDGQNALNEITDEGLVSAVYLAGGDFEWGKDGVSWIVKPVEGTIITEAQMSYASAYSYSGSTISATITLQQVGAKISISNISGNDWTLTANESEYQRLCGITSINIDFSVGAYMMPLAKLDNTLVGKEEDGKVVFYSSLFGATKSVKLTIANSSTGYSYSKIFPEDKILEARKAINVQGPELNPDGSLSVANGWIWNEDPAFRTITYTQVNECIMPMPDEPTQISWFGTTVNSHELGTIVFNGIVKKIGAHAFEGWLLLNTMSIPNSVTAIEESAFSWCEVMTSINLPEGLVSIGELAFESCLTLPIITLPSMLTSIGKKAFNDCMNLTTVTFLSTVPPTIADDAFNGCSSLANIFVPAGSEEAYREALIPHGLNELVNPISE